MNLNVLPRHKSELTVEGSVSHDTQQRFIRLFRTVWKKIPAQDRRKILRFWREKSQWVSLVVRRQDDPQGRIPVFGIILTDQANHKHITNTDTDAPVYGTSDCRGHLLAFYAPFIDLCTDSQACVLIAHEMGHVYCYATDQEYHAASDETDDWFFDLCVEDEADEAVNYWGFDTHELVLASIEHDNSMRALLSMPLRSDEDIAARKERATPDRPRFLI